MVDADDPVVDRLLEGAVDTHMHTAPDGADRVDTDSLAARKAGDNSMRAVVIKTHLFETAARAAMEMFRQFIAAILEAGVDDDDIATMVRENPRRILGLN